MIKYVGKGVGGAIVLGRAAVFKAHDTQVKRTPVADVEKEWERFEAAKAISVRQLKEIYEKALAEVGEAGAKIFEIHVMMIEDGDFNNSIRELIKCRSVNAEYAVTIVAEKIAGRYAAMEDVYMQARAADVRDISNRLIACLTEQSVVEKQYEEARILCADDLTPSETVLLDKDKVLAFVTAYGSVNSHTAILAGTRNIPAIVGVGKRFLEKVKDGAVVIVDGVTGELILEPDEETIKIYAQRQQEEAQKQELLQRLKGQENKSLDGRLINIYANIGSVNDTKQVLANDAGGIGLFRSESLYMERSGYPTENEQFEAYKSVLESMEGKPVIIRTLDIGADKQADYFGLEKEANPALGMRAIRLCLTRPELFKVQLRALYRASVYGKLGILFPMITSVAELQEILELCEQVKGELAEEGLAYSEQVELGIMIETPAAAIISDRLAPMVDFFSVGTNDLLQYTLACDRQNLNLERFWDTHHEAVLRLVELAARNAHANGIRIGICGELAADITLTEAFLRMGIDELSVSPSSVLRVREAVRRIDLSKEV